AKSIVFFLLRSVRCKLESSAPIKPPELMRLHAVCFHELKTAVVLLGDTEIHLAKSIVFFLLRSIRCKLESSAPIKPPELMRLHAVCFHELKTAVVLLGDTEIHLAKSIVFFLLRSVRCKLESSAPIKPPELMRLHAVCFHELKTAVVLLGDTEIHLVAMPSKEKNIPCF
ncbi:hypothetical protein HID58_072501, partial [Brassica napus]